MKKEGFKRKIEILKSFHKSIYRNLFTGYTLFSEWLVPQGVKLIRNKENDLKAYRFILKFGWTPVKALSVRVFPGAPLHDVYTVLKGLENLGVIVKEQGSYFALEGGEVIIEQASLTVSQQINGIVQDLNEGSIDLDQALVKILKLKNR